MYKGTVLDVHPPLRNPVKSRLSGGAKNPILLKTSQEVSTGIFPPL
jgi:hypothetical protein